MESRYKRSMVITGGSICIFIFIACLFWYKDGPIYAMPYIVLIAAMIIGSYPMHYFFKVDYRKPINPLRITSYLLILIFAVWAGYNTIRLF
jgi:hypothetical protein